MTAPGGDPFGTAALREAALSIWRTDPSRLRQDANLEEDHARGYYRDRVVIELAQNAADAATAAGVPGRLLLRLTSDDGGTVLTAANTGAPLTREGVAALASLRASAKTSAGSVGTAGTAGAAGSAARAGTVGRFGVGFAAVRSVSDDITVLTRPGGGTDGPVAGVRFSLAATAGLLAATAAGSRELVAEVARRDGDLPALRLPLPAGPGAVVPQGYTTAVHLRLRGPAGEDAVRWALAQVDDPVLLALPALGEVLLEADGEAPRRVADVAGRWITVHADGRLDPALLADRPVEERDRTGWSVTWALPRGPSGPPAGPAMTDRHQHPRRHVIHAPTPTDEPSTLPALLVASLPLDPSRRHVADGPATDALLAEAARLYARLAQAVADEHEHGTAPHPHPLTLVPSGLPAGAQDARLHELITPALARAEILREVGGGPVSPRAAQTIAGPAGQDPAVLAALDPMVAGLVAVPTVLHARARAVGVELRGLGDVLEALPTAEPAAWHHIYEALAPHAHTVREQLSTVPVPLADGRRAVGARGLLLPAPATAAALARHTAALPGLRVVHPDAAHPLLATLGATEADVATVLDQPEVRAAAEDEDPAAVDAVLDLVRAATADGARPDLPGWLGDLPLPGDDGDVHDAAALVLPGTWAADVLDLPAVDHAAVETWGAPAVRALGVRAEPVVITLHDVVAEPAVPGAEEGGEPEGWGDYLGHLAGRLGTGTYAGDLSAVADLDVVRDDAWPRVLARLAADPDTRAALLTPVRALSGGDPASTAPSYTAWWLRQELGAPFAHPRARRAVPFLPGPPDAVAGIDDDAVLAALGAVTDLTGMDAAGWDRYLDLWPEGGDLPMAGALTLWRGLAAAARGGLSFDPPGAVPALAGTRAAMRPAGDVAVGSIMWAQVRPVVPVPAELAGAVAELLDLHLLADVPPEATDVAAQQTPPEVHAVLPGAPATWMEAGAIRVDGADVEWWVDGSDAYATTTAGLARALAHAAGRWEARYAVEAVLADPDRLAEVLAEAATDPVPPGA